ncbi:exodeoxyribonuclease I [Marinobacterium nitratireducens]|uniref:Exodeoxyribonuclease I n=1 Tax=Marinobacterium nitratireducens TaxID=518897 RepID=A0A917ZG48_9GAMM|nr:exodeoxyribonuclease I [Marinobacterium nitratireducens]GGO82745.1 exodeoxyribonuclease I [Marinobacterium nitratireducens]
MSVSSTPTFFWHDYETFGADPRRDRPAQFAGVRTDMDLNIIEEPVMFYCKPAEDLLPNPEACLITGITPQQAMSEGVCEAEFAARVQAELGRPGTCGVGYNSIRFDDEVTRHTLYRNFYDPYAREWQNDCSRWDIIDMLRLTRALRPEGIEWPSYEDGSPSLRLEDLTRANGIEHGQAHDALSDVYATIGMARLVRERQPKLYQYVLQNRGKRAIQGMLDIQNHKPVLHVSSRYPSEWGNLALVAPLATHPVNRNSVIVWDLRIDPSPMLQLPAAEIRRLMYTPAAELSDTEPRIALKQLHTNKCPVVAPASLIRDAAEAARFEIDGDTCRAHLQILRNFSGLDALLTEVFGESDFEPTSDPDLMLYGGGFFGESDKRAMEQIRDCEPQALGELQVAFQDPRLEEMLLRYKARNYPFTLTDEERSQWEEFRRRKLLGPDSDGYLTMPQFYERLNSLYQASERTDAERRLLEELNVYAEAIYPMEEFF